jgi:hypothetical protein
MAIDKFWEDLTYDEWYLLQNKESLEFKAIEASHKTHPGFTLEEIKKFIYATIIESENNQKMSLDNFGIRHINSNKLNRQMNELFRILMSSGNEFKSIDNRGHGDIISVKFGETNKAEGRKAEKIGFRIEEKAVRFAQDLIQHNLVSHRTISDLVRTGFSKYMEMIPIINEIKDPIVDGFLTDMKHEREEREKLKIMQAIEGFKQRVESQQKSMFDSLRYPDNQEELEELRDWVVEFIGDTLSYSAPTVQGRLQIKRFIQEDNSIYTILTTLEQRKLLPREYIDSVRQKGVAIPIVNLMNNEDVKPDNKPEQ